MSIIKAYQVHRHNGAPSLFYCLDKCQGSALSYPERDREPFTQVALDDLAAHTDAVITCDLCGVVLSQARYVNGVFTRTGAK